MENINAGSLQLSAEELAAVKQIADEAENLGDRYGPEYMGMTLGDTPELKL